MPRKRRVALRALVDELARVHPELREARERILAGDVRVDGVVRTNPASLVRVGASIVVGARDVLRGEAKLKAALSAFAVPVSGRVALDVGAAAEDSRASCSLPVPAASMRSIRATGSCSAP